MADRRPFLCRVLVVLIAVCSTNAFASVRVSGTFQAVRSCDAFKSFRKGTNPGSIRLEPGQSYEIEELNEREGDWIRVNIPQIRDPLRWVPKECGIADFTQPPPAPGPDGRPGDGRPGDGRCNTANTYDSHVLAMSWQPGFCEHYRYSGRKPECDALEDGELVVAHLTIHGLWPNKQGCGTRYGNCGGAPLELSEDTVAEVAPWMPNLIYELALATHEWNKHGTCQSREDDEYFRLTQRLAAKVDSSAIGDYIKANIGREVGVDDFFAHVRRELGPGVEQRVQLVCVKGRYLQELRLSLPKDIVPTAELARLVEGAPKAGSRVQGCSSNKIYIERSGRD